MARKLEGNLRVTARGMVELRIRGESLTLGPESEWSITARQREREKIVAMFLAGTITSLSELRAGAPSGPPSRRNVPTFQEVAERFFTDFKGLSPKKKTKDDMEFHLRHLLGFFHADPVTEITAERIQAFRTYKVREREEIIPSLRRRKAAGEKLTDAEAALIATPANRGLGKRAINRAIGVLERVLREAVMERDATQNLLRINPASRKNLRFSGRELERPRHVHLETDQIVALLRAADEVERESRQYPLLGRQAIIATLALTGLRREELCALQRRDLNMKAKLLNVGDAKTENGIREVWCSPYLMKILEDWLRRSPMQEPGDPLFPTSRGNHRDPNNLAKDIIDPAVTRAHARVEMPLVKRKDGSISPSVCPHDFRRTYITQQIANGENPDVVVDQVGHSNSRLVMDLYRQRARRREPDPLRRRLYGVPTTAASATDAA